MNPLFRALVSYAMNAVPDLSMQEFVSFVTKLLVGSKEVFTAGEWDADYPAWWDELCDYQRNEVGKEGYEELLEDYRELLQNNDIEPLIPMAIHARTDISLDNAPKPAYRLKDIHTVYHLRWEDGQRAEYNCRPFGPENLDLTVPVLSKLTQIFADQFQEALLHPGLDAFHDQVATPFEACKFEELAEAMQEYINVMPAERREPYIQIYQRVVNAFRDGFSPETTSPEAMEAVRRQTSNTTLQWGEGPQDGGFQ